MGALLRFAATLAFTAAPAIADPTLPPAQLADPEHVSILDHVSELITDLRRDTEAADRVQQERINDLRMQLSRSIDDHITSDTAMAARVTDVEKRITQIDRNSARLDSLEARVDRDGTRLTELIAAGSKTAQEDAAEIAALKQEMANLQGTGAGVNLAWQVVLAIAGVVIGAVGAWAVLPRHPPPKGKPK